MPATPRQLWSLRIAFFVMLAGSVLILTSSRVPRMKALAFFSTAFSAAVIFVALRQAPRE
jgi:hypothetical protein